MKVTFATVFSFYLKTANCHWNVEDVGFFQYHAMFEQIYQDVYGSIDPMAEKIRTLGTFTPASLTRLSELSCIEDITSHMPALEMIEQLCEDSQIVIEQLNKAFVLATKNNKHGLANFLADRIEQHDKWCWFLKSTLSGK